jgi:uncharacterized protein
MKRYYNDTSDYVEYIPADSLQILKIKDFNVGINAKIGGWAALDDKEVQQLFTSKTIADKDFGEKAYLAGLAYKNGRLVFESEKVKLSPGVIYFFEFCLSNACNLDCIYCSNDTCTDKIKQPELELGILWIDRIYEYIKDKNAPIVTLEFTGGEPLVNAEFIYEVCLYAEKRFGDLDTKMHIVFATNLTVVGKKQLELLKRFDIAIQVSLDGPKFIHDKQRPFPSGKGSYDSVINNLQLVKDEGINIRTIASVITSSSVEYLPEITQLIIDLGKTQMTLQPMQAVGRGSSITDLAVNPKVYVDKLFEAVDKTLLPAWQKHKYKFHVRHLGIAFAYLLEPWRNYMCQRCPCGNSSTIISTDAYGDVYGCNNAPFNEETILGNIKTNTYEECQKSVNTIKFAQRSIDKIEDCSKCVFSSYCQAGCPKTALSIHGTVLAPGDLCDFNKALFTKSMEVLLENRYPGEFINNLASSYANWRTK